MIKKIKAYLLQDITVPRIAVVGYWLLFSSVVFNLVSYIINISE